MTEEGSPKSKDKVWKSGVRKQSFALQHQTSVIGHQTPDFKHLTSVISHQTKIEL